MRNKKAQSAIAIVLFIVSFVIVIQIKSVMKNNGMDSTQLQRIEDLQKELIKEKDKNIDLNKQLLQANTNLETYRENARQNDTGSKAMAEELKNAMLLAGLTDVEGEGVTVVLKDSTERSGENSSANYVIHDRDLRDIVNELIGSGAEAISINGERISSKSAIRCVGPTITINNNYYAPPFTIKAIGDPDTLEAGLNIRDGVVDVMRAFKIDVTITKSNKLQIPRYNGTVTYKHAEEVKRTAAR
ncbi:MAG: DUF881 domain-containing protein [Ruminococcaceae bacterium]|nr:DUF881 domain-containing protein [Oscillospiraceae bacterium]